MVSFYAGLRAKEIAALKLGDVFDDTGAVRDQFILSVDQSKGGQRRTVYLNQRLRKALATYAKSKCLQELDRPLFVVKKAVTFRPTQCVSCSWTSIKPAGLKMPPVIVGGALISPD